MNFQRTVEEQIFASSGFNTISGTMGRLMVSNQVGLSQAKVFRRMNDKLLVEISYSAASKEIAMPTDVVNQESAGEEKIFSRLELGFTEEDVQKLQQQLAPIADLLI